MPKNRYYAGPANGHFDGVRFFNTAPRTPDRTLRDVLRWQTNSESVKWPAEVEVRTTAPDHKVSGLRATVVGHATVLVQIDGMNILTDPVWSDRCSPFSFAGPRRVCAPGVAFEDLPPIHGVLLSHNHYDHLDIATLRKLVARDDPMIVAPLGNDAIMKRRVPKARIWTGDWWESIRLSDEIEITILPAQHWSRRGIGDIRMALWGGHAIRGRDRTVYFAGDTGYGDGSLFKEIRQRIGPPDLALLPIGAYEPRWFMKPQHANPAEAVQMMTDLGAPQALGIHWGVFKLTDEGRNAPAEALIKALAENQIPPETFPAAEPGHVWDGSAR
ncbi:MBL fold metallo-hydrolase [Methyloligella solikamskensis]|uniref:MBL fold metallo-hydrolase n=1 Tax=Methyloligella solikamskensis TaxID=1177756 RepID=A0ABW3J690_9HYPH